MWLASVDYPILMMEPFKEDRVALSFAESMPECFISTTQRIRSVRMSVSVEAMSLRWESLELQQRKKLVELQMQDQMRKCCEK